MPDRPSFIVVDTPRLAAGRTVFDSFGYIEPYTEADDSFASLPVRLVHDQGAGWHLEVGPYALSHDDIDLLRAAVRDYELAAGPEAMPRVDGMTSDGE